jgi:serine/threonine protein kinase
MSDQNLLPPRYEGAHLIARGGMGEVYRATDTALGREVAVKVLSDWYAADEEVRARFTREALAAARLSGEPNTVMIFDVGESHGRPFIVMAHLPGGSLADRVHGQPVEAAQALDWLEQAARALDAAHRNGVVHRDVKPANLLLDGDGTVFVADFGIASATGLESLTKTGTVLGTAGYLAPEQAAGSRATPASDRYALAVVAFELLTGTRPFAAESTTAEALRHARGEIPSVIALRPELPVEADRVFERALAKRPELRYPSCADFVADLRGALAGAPTTTRVLAPPVTSRVPARTLVIGAGLALVLAGVALAAMLDDEPRATQTSPTLVKTVVTTAPAITEQVTVTAEPQPPAPSGAELNDQAFALLGEGRYEDALPLAEQAFAKLRGSGELVEAYAAYNYAWALAGVGSCDEALPLLDHSEAIQGERKEISKLRKDCRKGAREEG